MKILFAHPADVAYADQAAASLTGVTVRIHRLAPLGRMYLIPGEQSAGIRDADELEQLAERVVDVEPPGKAERGEHL